MEIELTISLEGNVSGKVGAGFVRGRTEKKGKEVLLIDDTGTIWGIITQEVVRLEFRDPSPWKWVEWTKTGVIGEV